MGNLGVRAKRARGRGRVWGIFPRDKENKPFSPVSATIPYPVIFRSIFNFHTCHLPTEAVSSVSTEDHFVLHMMVVFLEIIILLGICLTNHGVLADVPAELVGTWSSKSNAVFTGPDFYDPVDELLIEPALPGISYSFTDDGFWEQAVYQVSGNPQDPKCPAGVLQFQHGQFEVLSNGSLVLTPFEVDGRQLVSVPCQSSSATYSRYNQTEFFLNWASYVDDYYGRWRLDLYEFNGAPMAPLYLSYRPPMMLPTETLNPTASSKPTSVSRKVRRALENRTKTTAVRKNLDVTLLWWFGVSLIFVGATGWFLM
jgi:hypothetical protein